MNDGEAAGEPLAGGNMSAVVRVGDTVRRDAGPWTPTIHRFLRHMHSRGVDWAPQPLGVAGGREALTYLPGTVPHHPLPVWVWADSVLVDSAARLAELHEAARDFDPVDARWQLPVHEPVEVVCHNDVAPYNLVFDGDRRICGLIDFDTASPGPRAWDLAYLAYALVPLTRPGSPDRPATGVAQRCRRLAQLCRAYGADIDPALVAGTAVSRLHELAEFTAARAAAGAGHVATHVQRYRDDADWLTDCTRGQ